MVPPGRWVGGNDLDDEGNIDAGRRRQVLERAEDVNDLAYSRLSRGASSEAFL